MNWETKLPELLHPHAEVFAATERPVVRLQSTNAAPPTRWSSCLGRLLFWPVGQPWPVDENKRPLFGLLQLNLAELPALPNWPTHGILQFFVSDDAFWGAHPLDPARQENFRLVYHEFKDPSTVSLLDDFSFLPMYEDLPLQRDLCVGIKGEADVMLMPPGDHRFETTLQPIFDELGDDKWTVLSAYRKAIGTTGHRLGGYASFVQDDPRPSGETWELLLQLESDPSLGMLWGDYGVAHWFHAVPDTSATVGERSLAAPTSTVDFGQVWYGWESS